MNKKEISEIRKQFSPSNCAITRICGCYVDAEKEKRTELKEAFLSLPEEEMFKYFEIFKKTLSGTIGKNIINLEFPLEQELSDGTQTYLLKLRDSKLKDDALVEEFYDKIIEQYAYGENYYIILIHAVYDVPGKSSAGDEMFDASDYVYEHIMCSLCPVKLSKAGLCYNETTNSIEDRTRDWIVEVPDKGFLFPAFHDRNSDIHGVLYYSKNPEELQPDFVENFLGCQIPLTAKTQKESFHSIIEDSLGNDCNYKTVMTIHEKINAMVEEHKEEPEPLILDKTEVKRILAHSGASEESLEVFDQEFERNTGNERSSFLASNIISTRKFEIKTPNITINVDPERTDLIETKLIDGRRCIVIQMDDSVQVNGINVKTLIPSGETAISDTASGIPDTEPPEDTPPF